MTDSNLLAFGCMVFFIAVAGVYVFVRERYEQVERESAPAVEAIPARRELKGAP